MKKNMLAVLILLVTVVNLTLNAYLIFTVLPNAQREDELITKILQIVDLELESPLPSDINITYSITDVEKYSLDEMTTNLASGEDGKTHYAKITASLTINTTDADYATLDPLVSTMAPDINQIFISNVQKYSYEELNRVETQQAIKEQVLADIQTLFNSKFIVDVTITYLIQ